MRYEDDAIESASIPKTIQSGQAIDAHEPSGEDSISALNPNVITEINFRLRNELNEILLTADQGIQKIRKTLHRYGFDLPAIYEADREGDELVIELNQFGFDDIESNIYILYYMTDKGVYDFYAEVGDDKRMDELLSDGL
jgi:hypothetical protein